MTSRKLIHGISGALVVGVLGFGAGQAAAAPVAAEGAYCTRQDQSFCLNQCADLYGEGTRAGCTKDSFGFIQCTCYTT
jgi:hypothetical protein